MFLAIMDNQNKTTNLWLIIVCKLLNDVLFLLLISFALAFLAEGLIPGFVSAHLNITKLAIIIFAVLGVIIYLGRKVKVEYEAPQKINKKWIVFLAVFSMLLIVNSLLKFGWQEIIIIVLATFLIFFCFYREIFPSAPKN